MGRYGIGARVRDDDGDEGVIVGKRKGQREVEYNCDRLTPGLTADYKKGEVYEVSEASVGHVRTVADANGRPNGWADDNFELVTEPAAPPAKFKVGDRVKSSGNTWTDYEVVAINDDDVDVVVIEKDGYRGPTFKGNRLSLFSLVELAPAPAGAAPFPKGTLVTLSLPGKVSGVGGNDNINVVFADLPGGHNSFALPASVLTAA